MSTTALDLGAGIGGWDVALERVAGGTALGVELSADVRAARAANDLVTIADDVYAFDARPLTGIPLVCGSPSCQPFSQANPNPGLLDDPRAAFMRHALRIVLEARPRAVALENVRRSRVVFESMRPALEEAGYVVDGRVVSAADYGLGQHRERYLFVARLDGRPVAWPTPTHYGSTRLPRAEQEARAAALGLKPWTTLAEALPHRTDLPAWAHARPSTTVVGSFRPEVLAAPGYRKAGDPSRQNVPGSVIASLEERLTLQGFPAGWHTAGSVSARGLQAGNAIPPVLAEVALRAAFD